MPIKRYGRIVFRMDSKRAYPDNIGNLQCTPQGIQEQPGANATALPVAMHGETRQNEKRYRIMKIFLLSTQLRTMVLCDII